MGNLDYLREKASALPRQPGVYIMQNSSGTVIYVGKSRSLRDRVSQYFHGAHEPKTARMADSVADFRFITCDTEMEALALENSLIKQYKPKYNIKLKDAKSYPYITIDIKSEWPTVKMTRKRLADGSLYFGPYSSTAVIYSVIPQVLKSLKLPSCKRKFPEEIGKGRPCIYYQMGKCSGACIGKVTQQEYRELIGRAAEIFKGGTSAVIASLRDEMDRASENLEFESAARYRDTIANLEKLGERQKAVDAPDTEYDVIGLHLNRFDGGSVRFRDSAAVFYVRSGYIADSEHFIFGNDEIMQADDGGAGSDSPMTAFIMSLYQGREYIPSEILLSFDMTDGDTALLSEYLSDRAGRKVSVRIPKKGKKRELCLMAEGDAARHSENEAKGEEKTESVLADLASLLGLEVLPERIEAYDISNLGSEFITCGMAVCLNGKMKKGEYRTFRIRGTDGQDDYAAMAEALTRRLSHIGRENDSMSRAPDLIFLDGGTEHVAAMKRIPEIAGCGIPVFGLVKDGHHKTRTITDESGEIDISRHQDVFRLVYGIQEEMHRYSVSRMSGAKRKTLKRSVLENINGIGPSKAGKLIRHFGSLAKVREATGEELVSVPGITVRDAEAIRKHFGKDEKET